MNVVCRRTESKLAGRQCYSWRVPSWAGASWTLPHSGALSRVHQSVELEAATLLFSSPDARIYEESERRVRG